MVWRLGFVIPDSDYSWKVAFLNDKLQTDSSASQEQKITVKDQIYFSLSQRNDKSKA